MPKLNYSTVFSKSLVMLLLSTCLMTGCAATQQRQEQADNKETSQKPLKWPTTKEAGDKSITYQTLFNRAIEYATNQEFERAYVLLEQIPFTEGELYISARDKLPTYKKYANVRREAEEKNLEKFKNAKSLIESGQFQSAIGVLKTIAKDSKYYQIAQDYILDLFMAEKESGKDKPTKNPALEVGNIKEKIFNNEVAEQVPGLGALTMEDVGLGFMMKGRIQTEINKPIVEIKTHLNKSPLKDILTVTQLGKPLQSGIYELEKNLGKLTSSPEFLISLGEDYDVLATEPIRYPQIAIKNNASPAMKAALVDVNKLFYESNKISGSFVVSKKMLEKSISNLRKTLIAKLDKETAATITDSTPIQEIAMKFKERKQSLSIKEIRAFGGNVVVMVGTVVAMVNAVNTAQGLVPQVAKLSASIPSAFMSDPISAITEVPNIVGGLGASAGNLTQVVADAPKIVEGVVNNVTVLLSLL